MAAVIDEAVHVEESAQLGQLRLQTANIIGHSDTFQQHSVVIGCSEARLVPKKLARCPWRGSADMANVRNRRTQ